jgi:hypothetical protein
VVVANPAGRRVELLQSALARLALPRAEVVAWADLLSGRAHLAHHVRAGDHVRVESSERDFEVERAMLALGADEHDDRGYARATREEIAGLTFDRGRVLWPGQWFLGFCAALRALDAQLAECPAHTRSHPTSDILAMFDKGRCHAVLRAAGVAVAPSLGAPRSFEALWEAMRAAGCDRVFVKLAYGSGASGVVAWRTDGTRHQAVTTVETEGEGSALRLYNTRKLRTLTSLAEIARVIDALCVHGVHVERWLPKAGVGGRTFDLRVVVIRGRARHTVVRMSRSPVTNLHLRNERGDPEVVRARAGESVWEAAMAACERAAGCFAESRHVGADVMLTADFQRHAVLELNAFGDLLPGVTHDGEDTYEAEARAMFAEGA